MLSLLCSKGFTLIELLIVVAIIGILAAIAIPNFLQAQVRAKVSRAASDMRTIAQANDIYQVDHNIYLPSVDSVPAGQYAVIFDIINFPEGSFPTRVSLTTPVDYLSRYPLDVFNPKQQPSSYPSWYGYYYQHPRLESLLPASIVQAEGVNWYKVISVGPDQVWGRSLGAGGAATAYDPTNGTVSGGDIRFFGGNGGKLKDKMQLGF
jgi:prepilin-type N-terminal cleavage/methylation domain-containing protein